MVQTDTNKTAPQPARGILKARPRYSSILGNVTNRKANQATTTKKKKDASNKKKGTSNKRDSANKKGIATRSKTKANTDSTSNADNKKKTIEAALLVTPEASPSLSLPELPEKNNQADKEDFHEGSDSVRAAVFQKFDGVLYSRGGKNKLARVVDVHDGHSDAPATYTIMLIPQGTVYTLVAESLLVASNDPRLIPGSDTNNIFWDSLECYKLFCPKKKESVWEAIDAQLCILDQASLSSDGWRAVVEGGNTNLCLSAGSISKIQSKALYLSTALRKAKMCMPQCTWTECCQLAMDELASHHDDTSTVHYKNANYLTQVYAQFRRRRRLPCPKLPQQQRLAQVSVGLQALFLDDEESNN